VKGLNPSEKKGNRFHVTLSTYLQSVLQTASNAYGWNTEKALFASSALTLALTSVRGSNGRQWQVQLLKLKAVCVRQTFTTPPPDCFFNKHNIPVVPNLLLAAARFATQFYSRGPSKVNDW